MNLSCYDVKFLGYNVILSLLHVIVSQNYMLVSCFTVIVSHFNYDSFQFLHDNVHVMTITNVIVSAVFSVFILEWQQ